MSNDVTTQVGTFNHPVDNYYPDLIFPVIPEYLTVLHAQVLNYFVRISKIVGKYGRLNLIFPVMIE